MCNLDRPDSLEEDVRALSGHPCSDITGADEPRTKMLDRTPFDNDSSSPF